MKKNFSRTVLSLVIALVALLGLIACAAPTPTPAPAPTPAPTPTPAPAITIASPSDGTELPAGDITVSVSVSNFSIVSKLGESPVPGEGHIHYYVDAEPPTTPGQPAVTQPGTYAATTETSHTWTGIGPGTHTFAVQLVNNDHTPLEPAVIDKVTVTVMPSITEEESRQAAEEFVRNSPTFVHDGIEDTLELDNTKQGDSATSWIFTFTFDSRHAGYGDRTGMVLAQVITPHEAVITVEEGDVTKAIMDGKWDMLEQKMLVTAPGVTITSPRNGAAVTAGDIEVSVEVSNFNLVGKLGQAAVPGEGHLHYYMDVEVPTTPGQPAVTEQGTYVVGTATTHVWQLVEPGEHTFSVQLVNNDHTPLEPPAFNSVTITVEPKPEGTGVESVTIDLVARSFAFDLSTITVPAGAEVTINFDNQDVGIPHNFAVYMTSSAQDNIFVGQVITGSRTITYKFTAPATPGTYFFRCDIHPTSMTGEFIVTE